MFGPKKSVYMDAEQNIRERFMAEMTIFALSDQ